MPRRSIRTPAWAWSRLGWLENYVGNPKEAIANFERSLRLSPYDPMNFNNYVGLGSANEILENFDRAAGYFRRALAERPNATWIFWHLASSLFGAGQRDEAQRAFARMMKIYPGMTISRFRQAMRFEPATIDRMAEKLRRLGLPE